MVQYNKSVVTDTGTYSIDYFTFDFLLLTTIRIFDLLIFEIEKRKSSCIKYQHFQSNYFGNLSLMVFGAVVLRMFIRKAVDG